MPRNDSIQVRRDTAATWTSVNPTLASGEIGFETNTGKFKIGTGSTVWTSLSYATTIPSDLALKANLASPTFTGTPAAPTPAAGTNSTQIATMASRPWNVAWGVMSYTSSTNSDYSITDEEVQLTGASFTAVSGRLYKVTYFEPGVFPDTGTGYVRARIRLTNISGTVLSQCYENLDAVYTTRFINLVSVGTIAAGTRNVVATLEFLEGTARAGRDSESKAFLFVEDIGPA